MFTRKPHIYWILFFCVFFQISGAQENLDKNNEPVETVSPDRLLLQIIEKQENTFDLFKSEPPQIDREEFDLRVGEILKKYENYISKYTEDVLGHILYGKLLKEMGREDEAFEIFLKADSINSQIAVVKESIGEYYAGKAMYQEAINAYFTAIELKPRNSRINFGLARVLGKKGDVKQSQFYFKKAIRLKPDEGEYYYSYGEFLMSSREDLILEGIFDRRTWDQEVLATFYEASRLTPNNIIYGKRYARVLMEVSDPDWEGIYNEWNRLENRAERDSDMQEARYFQALALYYLKDYQRSKDLLDSIRLPSLWASKKELLDDLASQDPQIFSATPVHVQEKQPSVSNQVGESKINLELAKELEKLINELAIKNKELEVLKNRLRDKDREMIKVQTDFTKIRDQKQDVLKGFQQQNERFQQLANKHQESLKSLKSAELTIEQLREQLDLSQNAEGNTTNLARQLENKRNELSKETEEKEKLKIALQKYKQQIKIFETERIQMQNQLRIAEKAKQELLAQFEDLKNTLMELKVANDQLRAQKQESEIKEVIVVKQDPALLKKNQSLNNELKTLKEDLVKKEGIHKELKFEIAKKSKQYNQALNDLEKASRKIQDLSQINQESENEIKEIKALKNQLEFNFATEIKRLNRLVADKESGISELYSKLDTLAIENQKLKADIQEMNLGINKKGNELLEANQNLMSELTELKEELTIAQNAYENLQVEIASKAKLYKKSLNDLEKENKKLKEAGVESIQSEASKKSEIRELRDIKGKLEKAFELEVARLKDSLAEKEQVITVVRGRLEDAEMNLKKSQNDLVQLRDKNQKLIKGIQAQAEKYRSLSEKFLLIQKELRNKEVEMINLRAILKDKEAENDPARFLDKIAKLESDLEEANSNWKEAVAANELLKKQFLVKKKSQELVNNDALAQTLELIHSMDDSLARPFERMTKIKTVISNIKETEFSKSSVEALFDEMDFLKSDLEFSQAAVELFYQYLKNN